jgi:hypothetical protein
MFRLLKALPLMLALAALNIFTTSCSSSNQAQVRVVNAIPDGPAPLDIEVNGTKIITNLAFDAVQPATTPATYLRVPSGTDTFEALSTGTSTVVLPSSHIGLSGSKQYTIVAAGFEANQNPPLLLTDNNTAPTSGNVEFRIVHASPSGTTPVDVYIVNPPGTNISTLTPQISALAYGQASTYVPIAFASNGYSVVVTANGNKTPIVDQNYTPAATGSIWTLVLVDNQGGGNGMSTIPLLLQDVN